MSAQTLTSEERTAVIKAAQEFKRQARWTPPRFATGHRIAHEDPKAQACNWSTRTRIVKLNTGRKVYLVYRYTFSWMHVLFDNFLRLLCGRKSAKTLTERNWHDIFERKSRINVYSIGVPEIVAMEYVPNLNLWDVLYNNYGQLQADSLWNSLEQVSVAINTMHLRGTTWGDMIVNNIILRQSTLVPEICDTEVSYWKSVPLAEQKARDWRELIFSVVGSDRHFFPDKAGAALKLFGLIGDPETKAYLKRWAKKRFLFGQGHLTFWQWAMFAGYGGQLSCSFPDYVNIRKALAEAEVWK